MQISISRNECLFLNQSRFKQRRRQHSHHPRFNRMPLLRAVGMDDLAVDAKNLGVSFTPIHEDFGADVLGMDLDGGISEAQGALVKDALDRFLLLRFRQQTPEPADEAKLLSFLPHDEERFKRGEFKTFISTTVPGFSWLAIAAQNMDSDDNNGSTSKRPKRTGRRTWHMDASQRLCPHMYSYMYMKIAAPNAGTAFASTVKAYSLLTDEQKQIAHKNGALPELFKATYTMRESGVSYENPRQLEELVKSSYPGARMVEDGGPFVIQEKGTGVRSLLATPFTVHSFEGMSVEETHELLEEFLGPQGATAPERVWIADWQPGDVIVWKNRQLIHASPAPGSYDEPRLNHLAFWESSEPVIPVEDVAA
ncbi:hypothetical protein BSKO_12519 [Bryopsis sp. KO-2023]|nr:hypothetical protein BSKO_12519 [Bryopsis sp. KO-2023]